MQEMSTESRDWVQAYVSARKEGDLFDPTALTVEFAFTTGSTKPGVDDWTTGSWDGDEPRQPTGEYVAQVLVGPDGDIELEAGTYTGWVRVTDDPERPVIPYGQLRVV